MFSIVVQKMQWHKCTTMKQLHAPFARNIYSKTGIWGKKYKKQTRMDIEDYWSTKLAHRWKLQKQKANEICDEKVEKNKFYCLSMFPYPSGQLHMGHIRVYTISDAIAHYHRMKGKEVLHPMGWDSFGLPAENAALTRGLDPADWTKNNISYMKKQMMDLNMFFDWDREISTCSPEYYKWTQYLFLKLLEKGLAYKKKAAVNWDPIDKTVLADEQVNAEGRSWRSGAIVEKKVLDQWFLRTTQYASSLLETLPLLEENYGIKSMQKHWIGNVNGCYVNFDIIHKGIKLDSPLPVFCTHPEHLACASHINLQMDHICHFTATLSCKKLATSFTAAVDGTSHNHVVDEMTAVNPFTQQHLPLVASDHHEESLKKASAVLGIPIINSQDQTIADNNSLCYSCNSFLSREDALKKIKELNCGLSYFSSSNLQDWLISRQRRWGTPIPVVYCEDHGTVAVPKEDLPVLLPAFKESLESWKKTHCPVCGGPAEREIDTMDTFVDSAWYFFRYADPHNKDSAFSKEKCDHFLPVDLYIGGKEHALLHLYYARFFSHFCADLGLSRTREPFKKLLAQGIIRGKTFKVKVSGKYLHPKDVKEQGSGLVEATTGLEVETSFEKMSKSKYNGVDPKEFVDEWGISVTRLFVLYAAAPFESIDWDVKTDVIPGVMRWQMKLWTCVTKLINARQESDFRDCEPNAKLEKNYREIVLMLNNMTNETIRNISNHFENTCLLSAVITCLMTLTKYTYHTPMSVVERSPEYEHAICTQVIMSAPLVPHFASELWEGLCSMKYKLTDHDWNGEVLDQKWPSVEKLCSQSIEEVGCTSKIL